MESSTLGARLREARQKAGLTQKDAADALGVTYQAISNYERDKCRVLAGVLKPCLVCREEDFSEENRIGIENMGIFHFGEHAPEDVRHEKRQQADEKAPELARPWAWPGILPVEQLVPVDDDVDRQRDAGDERVEVEDVVHAFPRGFADGQKILPFRAG